MTQHTAWSVYAGLFFLIVGGQVTAAQLGDVAQREAERRKQAATGKVYTNGDLAPVDESAPAPVSVPTGAAPVAAAADPAPSPETPAPKPAPKMTDNPGYEPVLVAGREKRDEEYWRKMARDLRGRVAQANAGVAAQQARLAELEAGPQTPTAVREREVISASLARIQRDAGANAQELARFISRAQLAKVPGEWIQ